ncbi:ABC transporter substrate-binding protein [Paracoccus sp. MBLB3053]|uniref:ABC transporter substrate-binding protein n=1 Tax=Paracoccus aurantius TaxID=3073814 RepID=A0ABU2HXW7_9RHOB|nr:ABC transporter substrate-binding protein [Paracoccus sp. MBLB3053]MDS9469144.1 ABC transporter substrate-binding protein [Paracoccus sp. MBLB3053]
MRSAVAFAAAGPVFAQTGQGTRLAAIDWAMFETAVALGHMPVAACELIRYRAETPSPVIPDDVVDLGLRGAPNFELLQLIRPDFILTSPFYIAHEAKLRTIAPVVSLPFYMPGEAPLAKMETALVELGRTIGARGAARAAMALADQTFANLSTRLHSFRDRPVCLVNIGDERHLRAFGFDSLPGDALARLGLNNAWAAKTQFSFRAPLPIERLADMPEARLVIIGDVPIEARAGLSNSMLWRALPPISEGRLYQLPEINVYGGLPSALRFATLLVEAFEAGPIRT